MRYRAPLADIGTALTHAAGLDELLRLPGFGHLDEGTVADLLAEGGRFAEQVLAPTLRAGDLAGVRLEQGRVRVPPSFRPVYRQLAEAGWASIGHPVEHGGAGAPLTLTLAVREMLFSANLSLAMCPFLAGGLVTALLAHGSDRQRDTYVPRLVSGEWAATMCITEPQAGSDVGAVTTRAVRTEDGTYRVSGQKIFISYGDHDLTEQILHLVLARLPGAPAGTRGLSLFLVPKRLVGADGNPAGHNDVVVTGVEHKLGLRGSPTCSLTFGAGDGAVAELVGEEHRGIAAMFTMMNDARLGVGLQGVALAELACQSAVAYARERVQGRTAAAAGPVPVIEHPDVRRTLLGMRATVAAMRALAYATARAMDLAAAHPDAAVRAAQQARADLLTPVCKAWCTDLAVEVVSRAVQVFGGSGFVEETGIAQLYRDVRITPIYEGTNGIQAIDLVARKVLRDGGRAVQELIGEAGRSAAQLDGRSAGPAGPLRAAVTVLAETTAWLVEQREATVAVLAGAAPYLRLLGTVVGGALLADTAHGSRVRQQARDEVDRTGLLLRVYTGQVLPDVHALARQVASGAEDLYPQGVDAWA
ncbi:acyl-CoA dehydrogenase [Blastococcus sp. SYSU D00669]